MARFLVEAGSQWLEKNPARSQALGRDMYDTTNDPKYASVFATEEQAAEAAAEFKEHYPDWPVRVRSDWRVVPSTLTQCFRCGVPFDTIKGAAVLCDACHEMAMKSQDQKAVEAQRKGAA